MEYLDHMPQDVKGLLMVLAASFLIGLSMAERKMGGKAFSPGGVRTFPLICLLGYLLWRLGAMTDSPGASIIAFSGGLLAVAAWTALLYRGKIAHQHYGMTTEAFALATYVLGGLIAAAMWWLAAAITVLLVMFQALKEPLERASAKMPAGELATIARFILLTAVILPLTPDRPFTRFQVNPRTVWLVVVAVASISYASYILQRIARGRGGLLLGAVLGGAYSSTLTAVVLSKRSRTAAPGAAARLAGGTLIADGVMHFRLLVLISLFNAGLAGRLLLPLAVAGAVGMLVGVATVLARQPAAQTDQPTETPPSPLELGVAITFAVVFVAVWVASRAVFLWLGESGLYATAALSGFGVVNPFVMSVTQQQNLPMTLAAFSVMLAVAVNHLANGIYVFALARGRTGATALVHLAGLAAATLIAWFAI